MQNAHKLSKQNEEWLQAAPLFVLAIVLPLLMVLANKSTPVSFFLAFGLFLAGAVAMGQPRLQDMLSQIPRTPLTLTLLVFLALGLNFIPLARPDALVSSLLHYLGFIAIILASLPFFYHAQPLACTTKSWYFILALVIASLIVAFELSFDYPLRRLIGGRPLPQLFNRSIVTILLFLWPAILFLMLLGKTKLQRAGLIFGLILTVCFAIARAESGASVLGAMVGIAVYGCALILPRLTTILFGLGTYIVFFTSPWLGKMLGAVMTPKMLKATEGAHAADRIAIYKSFGATFDAGTLSQKLFGFGFDSTDAMQKHDIAARLPIELREMLGVSHPHNAFLQIWVELGLVGVLVFAAFFYFLLREIWKLPQVCIAPVLAFLATICAIAAVSHGAWQAWWWAAICAGAMLFRWAYLEIKPVAPFPAQ